MSPRRLANLYPCKGCGEPCEVETRRDIARAICDRCTERRSGLWLMSYGHEKAMREAAAANGQRIPLARVSGWLKSLGGSLETMGRGIEVLPLCDDRGRLIVLKNLRETVDHARRNLAGLDKEIADLEREHGPRLHLVKPGRTE